MGTRPFLAASLAAAVIAGCAAPPSPPPPAPPSGAFVPLDPAARSAVESSGLLTRELADGRLEVVASLANRLGSAARVQVQCVFEDASGNPVGDPSDWRTVALDAGSTETVRFDSPDARARACAIRVRQSP
jgi:hypothetical protein